MLRYLVDPIFQVLNTAGKPATGGYIEVYLHGTRDKYYCASDFNGTLHPFKIPLDSLGANIILADDANAYDIYVYNRYGSLLMSRYNVAPVQGGGSGGGDHIGKVHFLKAVSDHLADVRAPYSFWIVDLEKPNPESPYGYDYAMAEEVISQLSAGEVFVLSTYPTAPSAEEDVFIICNSQNQSREGRQAVRIWFTQMFAANDPEYMYFTTIYTPSTYNSDSSAVTIYPEGRMAILNWRGQQDSRSEFHFMPYTELADVATTGDYNDLRNKPTIPAAQVQSDWSQSDNTKVDYIKNKPSLATVATSGSYDDLTDKPSIPAAQKQSDWTQSNSSAVDYIKNKPKLSTVATSGDYDDLTNKPTIPPAQVQSDWDEADNTKSDYIKNKPNLATVATSGSYDDLSNKPSIPDPQVQADWSEADNTKADYIKNKPNLATVATSGSYNDLSNKPTIPVQQQADWNQSDSQAVDYIKNKPNLALKENVSNKVQTINDASTTDYPSSKAVAEFISRVSVTFDKKIQRGLNTSQKKTQAYSLVGTLKVTDSDKRGMMAFELFCCKRCANPIRMHATFGYQADNNLNACYSVEASVKWELARYKLSWRFADNHSADAPKIEIWLIDTFETGADQRRCGCFVHMVEGIEWIDGNQTTDTLPSGLTDFTPFYPRGETVNVNNSDGNTDTSSFVFVNGHVYHLTVEIVYTELHIDTTSSGIGHIVAYIGSSAVNNHYSSRQEVYIQKGAIQTYDIRLPVDWKAENIAGSSDNKLHIKVMFGNTEYTFVQSDYSLVLVGTDFG